ncbi:MAG: exodeoxyribonuclease VII large subunit [Flavobacteriales bacterium]
MKNTKTSIRTFTLTELGESIQSVMDSTYKKTYWVKAEIVKLNYYPKSGHCYPDLVDKVNNRIKAQFRGILWGKDYQRIEKEFLAHGKLNLKSGMKVLMEVKVQYHPLHGLSLHIINIDVNYTIGEMALSRAITVQKLKSEGIFDRNKRLDFPILPKRLAIVSVETSKGFQDFENIIRKSNYGVEITLFPALLQGDAAVGSIKKQLEQINARALYFDAVAVIRGGGGEIGLDCYDAYILSEQITKMQIPVLAGIGHAANTTVTELVSFQHFITPTDLAYYIVNKFDIQSDILKTIGKQFNAGIVTYLQEAHEDLDWMSKNITTNVHLALSAHKSLLNTLLFTFNKSSSKHIWENKMSLAQTESKLKNSTKTFINRHNQNLQNNKENLSKQSNLVLNELNNQIKDLALKLKFLNPENVLKRGYSLQYNSNGDILTTSKSLKKGDALITKFKDGEVQSTITKVKNTTEK